jgi:hypothetical protein
MGQKILHTIIFFPKQPTHMETYFNPRRGSHVPRFPLLMISAMDSIFVLFDLIGWLLSLRRVRHEFKESNKMEVFTRVVRFSLLFLTS